MNVEELIEKLKTLPLDATVKTWNPYRDEETEKVCVSTDKKGTVWIMDSTLGYPEI